MARFRCASKALPSTATMTMPKVRGSKKALYPPCHTAGDDDEQAERQNAHRAATGQSIFRPVEPPVQQADELANPDHRMADYSQPVGITHEQFHQKRQEGEGS